MGPDETLLPVPVVDLRDGGPVRGAIEGCARVRALRDDCLSFLPAAARLAVPLVDVATRRWLRRSCSPYVTEVEALARALGYPGVWFLNGCYQWGCTTLARDEAGAPWLARTLDWPFPGLGRHLQVAHMRGRAGEFSNVTWPGYVGCLTASAPGRFAAAVNQAPMWRRTRHPWLRPYDLALNARRSWGMHAIPPDHLLRQVFESCADFAAARHRLETTPIARPVIFTLVGCVTGERCVIERTEDGFTTRSNETAAANDWFHASPRWEARVRADLMFTRSYEEAAESSRARRQHISAWPGSFADTSFEWVAPPVLNPYTRVAVEACPRRGSLRVVGYEMLPRKELPVPVTRSCDLAEASGALA